ncbi:MAG: hypothetical protein HQL99_12520 [Magnetococcales bacterium]|nr:hypothetical protein [Magnetococcales bacterium]
MEKIKDGPGGGKKELKAQAMAGKPGTAEERSDPEGNTVANHLDAVLQRQINDKLKANPTAPKPDEKKPSADVKASPAPMPSVKISVDTTPRTEMPKPVSPVATEAKPLGIEPAKVEIKPADPAKVEPTPVTVASKPEESKPVVVEAAKAAEKKPEAVVIAPVVDASKPEDKKAEEKKPDPLLASAPVTESKPEAAKPAPLAETPKTSSLSITAAVAPKEEDKKVAAPAAPTVNKDDPWITNARIEAPKPAAPVTAAEPVSKPEAVAVKAADPKPAPVSQAPLSATPVVEKKDETAPVPSAEPAADKKAELSGLVDRFTDLARTASPAVTAEAAPPAPEVKEDASLGGMPRKDPYVAAAEKERVLKMIRDAASKRMEDGFDLRSSLKAKNAAQEETPEESNVGIPTLEPVGDTKPHSTFTIQEDVTTTARPTAAGTQTASAPESVSATPSMARFDFAQPQASPIEEIQNLQPGILVPPIPRAPALSRPKMDSLPSPTQTRLTEAFLRQLKGEEPLDDEPVFKPAQAKTEETQATAAAAPKKSNRRRVMNEDGTVQVPVETLGTGIFNALGDMIGAMVQESQTVANKVKTTVVGPEEEPEAEMTGPKPTGTDRAAQKIAKGVQGAGGGVADIIVGAGNIALGAVGIVTMPVVGAVGAIFRAFKTTKK